MYISIYLQFYFVKLLKGRSIFYMTLIWCKGLRRRDKQGRKGMKESVYFHFEMNVILDKKMPSKATSTLLGIFYFSGKYNSKDILSSIKLISFARINIPFSSSKLFKLSTTISSEALISTHSGSL